MVQFILLLALLFALETNALSSSPQAINVLKSAAAGPAPEPYQVTRALLTLRSSTAQEPQQGWIPTLSATTTPWRPVFYASAAALRQEQEGKYYSKKSGCHQLNFDASAEEYDTGAFARTFCSLFFRALRCTMKGDFTMNGGRSMKLAYKTLEIRLLWLFKLSLPIQKGGFVRTLWKQVRGDKKGPKFEKRIAPPSVYTWYYADDDICVARGTAGSFALWGRKQ